jgi:hypothetical protein
MRRAVWAAGVAVLMASITPRSASAVSIEVSRESLCDHATLVVVAEATGGASQWASGPLGGIETWTDFSVGRVLVGTSPDPLSVVSPGGVIGQQRYSVEDAAVFVPDQRYLLLLAWHNGGWRPVGGEHGAIPVRRNAQGRGEDEAAAIASLGVCIAR